MLGETGQRTRTASAVPPCITTPPLLQRLQKRIGRGEECPPTTEKIPCSLDCEMSEWSEWSECNATKCADNPIWGNNLNSWINERAPSGNLAEQTATYTISKEALGTGTKCKTGVTTTSYSDPCWNTSTCPEVYSKTQYCTRACPYYPLNKDGICPGNYELYGPDCYKRCDSNYSFTSTFGCYKAFLGPDTMTVSSYYRDQFPKISATCSNDYFNIDSNGKCTNNCASGYTFDATTKICSPIIK